MVAVVPVGDEPGHQRHEGAEGEGDEGEGGRLERTPVPRRVDAELLAGVGLEGDLRVAHHLAGELVGHVGVEAAAHVDGGQLATFDLGVALEWPEPRRRALAA